MYCNITLTNKNKKGVVNMKEFLRKITQSNDSFSQLALRIPIGIILMAHGAQKLFGWFGGYGLEGVGGWMESIGLSPGILMAFLAGSAEFFGGLFIVLGLLIRPSAFVAGITMVVAILVVHLEKGLFVSNGGYEFGLALLAATVSLMISGSGAVSLDKIIEKKLK